MTFRRVSRVLWLGTFFLGETGHAQAPIRRNELALSVGVWIGGGFIRRTASFTDPLVGRVEFGTALSQQDAVLIGLRYTYLFNRWLGAEATVAYLANTWESLVGVVENGVLTGTTGRFPSVSTVAFSGGVLLSLPGAQRRLSPFVSLGVGGVHYEIERVVGPLTFTPTTGAPVDTLLFDLDLGTRFAPNIGAGIRFPLSRHVGSRLEGRLWSTLLWDAVRRETLVQDNASVTVSLGYVF